MTIEQILVRLQRHADVGPALFSITQEDARRICEHVAGLKRPVSDEVVAARLEALRTTGKASPAAYIQCDYTEKDLRHFKTRIDAWLRRGYAVDR